MVGRQLSKAGLRILIQVSNRRNLAKVEIRVQQFPGIHVLRKARHAEIPGWRIMDRIEKTLNEIDKYCLAKELPSIGQEKAKIIKKIIQEKRPKTALEVGTLVGYSAILIASAMPEGGKLITLEFDKKSAEIAKNNVSKAGFENKIWIIIGDAKKTLPNLKEEFDLVFIDANKTEYLAYLKLAEPKMRRKAVVIADNVKLFGNEMQDYLDYVRKSGKYESKTIEAALFSGSRKYAENSQDNMDAIEVSVKK